jgi:hypothetical protein
VPKLERVVLGEQSWIADTGLPKRPETCVVRRTSDGDLYANRQAGGLRADEAPYVGVQFSRWWIA